MSGNKEIHQQDEPQEEPSVTRGLLRLMAFLLVVDIVALVFGIAFFLIAHGLAMGVIRQAWHWQPARSLFQRIIGHSTESTSQSGILRTIGAVHSVLMIALTVAIVGLGIWLLLTLGFWEQNIIWIVCH